MKYRSVVFDWDGTLHRTELLYISAFNEAMKFLIDNGYAEAKTYTDKEITSYLGMTAEDMWKLFMPELPQKIKDHCSAMVGRYMTENIYAGKARMYDGAVEVLDKLKEMGLKLYILSNCQHSYLEAGIEYFKLGRWFEKCYAAGDYGFKSKPDILSEVIKADGIPAGIIMAGDRFSDMEVGKLNDTVCIGCAYGFGERSEYESAASVAENVRDIPAIIRKLEAALPMQSMGGAALRCLKVL